MAGESPDTQKAKAMLLAEKESAAPAAAAMDIAADSSIAELKEVAQKCIARSVTLHDVEAESVAAQAQLYDIPRLHEVLGTFWADVEKNFERIVTAIVVNSGSDVHGRMTLAELRELLPPLLPVHFLDRVSSIRVRNLANSFKSSVLSVWLFESIVVGMLHPPKHVILPTEAANSIALNDEDDAVDEEFKAMLDPSLLMQRSRSANATISGVKLAISGSGKSHTLSAILDMAKRIRWPDELSDGTGEAPINRPS